MISLLTPSGPLDPKLLKKGLLVLQKMGFESKKKPATTLTQHHYLCAGTKAERLTQLFQALEKRDIIWCARGGTGSNELLPEFTTWLTRHTPKARAFIGLSDPTPLMNHLAHHMPVVYGPMIATHDFIDLTPDRWSWLRYLLGEQPRPSLPMPYQFFTSHTTLEGSLIGGTLAMLTSLLGTPYDIGYDGHILFLEDVHEPEYRLLRLFMQLIQSGKLSNITGLVLGSFTHRTPRKHLDMKPLLSYLFPSPSFPIIYNFPLGHCDNPIALPLHRRLRFAHHTVEILEN